MAIHSTRSDRSLFRFLLKEFFIIHRLRVSATADHCLCSIRSNALASTLERTYVRTIFLTAEKELHAIFTEDT